MLPVYVTKNLAAASSTGIGTFSSAGVVTLTTPTLDTARRIIIWGSTSVAGTITITGKTQTGTLISETIVGSTIGSAVATTQDFLTVTNVSIPAGGVTSTTGYIGTNTLGGTPWSVVDTNRTPVNLGFTLTPTTSSILVSLEYTMDAPIYNVPLSHWDNPNNTVGPPPTISSLGSSVTAATIGNINFPVAAWRVTLTSTSSSAGTANATVIQSG